MTRKKAPDDVLVDGFTTPRVCALTGIPPSTLDYWVSSGLLEPSFHASTGRRATRVWSLQDVVLARSVRALREAGCPLQTLRQAKARIEDSWGEDLRQLVLSWSGGDLLVLEPWGTVRSAIVHPGQGVLHVVAIPLAQWRTETAGEIETEINLSRLQRLAKLGANGARRL